MYHMGIEPGRVQISGVSSAESTKFVKVVTEVTQTIKELGPNTTLVKTTPKVAENVELHQ
jgi:F420-non-reducing hydrogenase iron-sulfur subunit